MDLFWFYFFLKSSLFYCFSLQSNVTVPLRLFFWKPDTPSFFHKTLYLYPRNRITEVPLNTFSNKVKQSWSKSRCSSRKWEASTCSVLQLVHSTDTPKLFRARYQPGKATAELTLYCFLARKRQADLFISLVLHSLPHPFFLCFFKLISPTVWNKVRHPQS